MNKPRIISIAIMIALAVLSGTSCHSSSSSSPDAVSGATSHAAHTSVTLPTEVGDYDVLGERDGLNGFVVKYDDTVYRGGEPYADSAAKTLRKLGVKTIVSITPTEYEREFCHKYRFVLVEIPFDKNSGITPEDSIRLREAIQTGDGSFYLHCKGGSHRGGVMGAAYRIFILGWSSEKAIAEYDRLGGDLVADQKMLDALRRISP